GIDAQDPRVGQRAPERLAPDKPGQRDVGGVPGGAADLVGAVEPADRFAYDPVRHGGSFPGADASNTTRELGPGALTFPRDGTYSRLQIRRRTVMKLLASLLLASTVLVAASPVQAAPEGQMT